ncbi:MAG: antitoxin VapB family protein [Candidatus Sigynarchaeota archaeon]
MMTSIQISIKKQLQERLKALKGEDESYSDVIERLLDGQGNLQEFIKCHGIAKGENEGEIHDAYAEARALIREKFRARFTAPTTKEEP